MRRGIVLALLIAVGALSLAAAGSQGQPQARKLVLQEVGNTMRIRDTLYVLTGGGGTTAALIANDGVVLVDTKLAGFGQPILDELRTVTDKPVTTIINTHTHGDHTGSNNFFPTTVDIIAHENTKANMAKMDAFKGENAKFLPKRTYRDKMSLLTGKVVYFPETRLPRKDVNPDQVDLYYFGAGHTNGDTIVVFPGLRVACVGDLFTGKSTPVIDVSNGGSGVAYPETLAKAVAGIKDVDTVIPGHGPPPSGSPSRGLMTWKDLQEYAAFNRDFLAAVQEAMKAGKSAEVAAASLKLPETYKDYGMEHAKANVQAIYNELKK